MKRRTWLVALLLTAAAQAVAVEPMSPSAGPEAEFANLPAYDLERADAATSAAGAAVRVGDSITLKVSGKELEGAKLAAPPGGENLAEQGWALEPNAQPGDQPSTGSFKVTAIKAGHLVLPSLAIQNAAGQPIGRTNPWNLEVQSTIKPDDPKAEEPADLRPPVSLAFPWWVLVAGAFLLIALVAAAIYAFRRWRAQRPSPVISKPIEPPKPEDEVALAALAELERGGPLRRGEFKKHYFAVSEILKAYLGARYRFDASESTTRELIQWLERERALTDAQLDRLETMYDRLDLVKFTDHVPETEEGHRLLEQARELVRATRRLPSVMAPGAGGQTR